MSVDWSRERIYGRATSGAWGVIGGVANHLAFWRTPPAREPAASPTMEARAAMVNDLRDWLARMRYAIAARLREPGDELASVPMPWDPAEQLFQPELAVRLAALGGLAESKVLSSEEYARQRAIAEALSAPEAGYRWTAEELTAVKLVTDQISGAVSYFAADLLYTGTVQTASQIWALDQVIDAGRYTVLEYGWQRFGPRRLADRWPGGLARRGRRRLAAGGSGHDIPELGRWRAGGNPGRGPALAQEAQPLEVGRNLHRERRACGQAGGASRGHLDAGGARLRAGRRSWMPMRTARSRP